MRGSEWVDGGDEEAHLIPQGPQQILHALSVILAKFAQVFDKDLVEPCMPVVPYDSKCTRLEHNEIMVPRVSTHDFKAIRCILEEI